MSKFQRYLYIAIAALILLYATIRLIFGPPTIRSIVVKSGTPGPELSKFILHGASDVANLPRAIVDNFPAIENASVRNGLNGTLIVHMARRKIIGIWTDGKNYYPLAIGGTPIRTVLPGRPSTGLVFRGDVPADTTTIIQAVSAYPALVKKTDYLEYIENRRWNIRTTSGGVIMLPEHGVASAIDRLRTSGILGKTFSVLDLRDPRRILVK